MLCKIDLDESRTGHNRANKAIEDGDFIANVAGRTDTTIKLSLLGWRSYGEQDYQRIDELTTKPVPMIELLSPDETISDRIQRRDLVELTVRVTADDGRMLFKVGPGGLKKIELESKQGGPTL